MYFNDKYISIYLSIYNINLYTLYSLLKEIYFKQLRNEDIENKDSGKRNRNERGRK